MNNPRPSMARTRTSLTLVLALVCLAIPSLLAAQIPVRRDRERPLEALLFLTPLPDDRVADSAYAVALAEHIRERFGRWHRHEAMLIEFCEETESCGALVPDTLAHQYATSVGADFYVFGRFWRDPAPVVRLHIYETGRRGGIKHHLSTIEVRAESDVAAQSFAGMVNGVIGDTLGPALASARDARDCWSDVVDREYESAKGEAMSAMQRFANHPSAASCLAYIYGATGQADSLLWALERAVAGDSSLTHVWERLGELYMNAGDTARAIEARLREVATDPDDIQRRVRIARLMNESGRRDDALGLLQGGVDRMGENLEMRRLLVRMCMQYEMWACAQENMGVLYALDSTLVGDTTFYFQMIGLAQARAENEVVIWWTEEAVKQVDSLVAEAWERVEAQRRAADRIEEVHTQLRMSHAATLREVGLRDSALTVYWGILGDHPENVRAALATARLVTEGREFGPGQLTSADSAALTTADSLFDRVTQLSEDTAVLETVGVSYYDVGARLVRNRQASVLAAEWLEKSLAHVPSGYLVGRGNAMLAIALAYLVEDADAELRAEPSCELIDREAMLLDRARSAVAAGSDDAMFAETVTRIGEGLGSYAELIPEFRDALACDSGGTGRGNR